MMIIVVTCVLAVIMLVIAQIIATRCRKDREKSSEIMMSVYHESISDMKDKIQIMEVMLDNAHYFCYGCNTHIELKEMVYWANGKPHCSKCANEIQTPVKIWKQIDEDRDIVKRMENDDPSHITLIRDDHVVVRVNGNDTSLCDHDCDYYNDDECSRYGHIGSPIDGKTKRHKDCIKEMNDARKDSW